ncbi:glycosyltransferase [Pseudoalteromonas piscicida]|uniref:Glycosyltransferase n=1 Tax=Pseudoalteromonas piscicida TaxID=43662 RepID=A0ABN5CH88_PSEO7|nr:glycosyltransferase [Pseudoalteromonas piscicida]ATD08973.1 hypothetical protein PPIS_a4331 [Pseudoalteromonas piscicida]WPU30948.1 glycosyltransferase [Pseudoalteromonas piscicida]
MKSVKSVNIFVLDVTLKGGIERFCANLANSLVKKGMHVRVYSLHKTNDKPLYPINSSVEIFYISKFKFYNNFYKITTLYACLLLRRMSFLFNENCKIISTHPITTILLNFLGFKMSNLIASEHSSYESHGKLVCFLRKRAYKSVNAIVTQTKSGYESFKSIGLESTTIYNSTVNFSDSDQWKYNTNENFLCLSVARVESVKQLHIILYIAKEIKSRGLPITFAIVGDGSEKESLQHLSAKLGVSDMVTFYPATNDVFLYYKKAALYLITSKTESFSMTMTEALSYSVPVISNGSLVGPSEVIINGLNGFLCKDNDVSEFSDLIEGVYRSADLKRLKDASLRSAFRFNEDKVIDKWLALINLTK